MPPELSGFGCTLPMTLPAGEPTLEELRGGYLCARAERDFWKRFTIVSRCHSAAVTKMVMSSLLGLKSSRLFGCEVTWPGFGATLSPRLVAGALYDPVVSHR